VSDRPVAIVIHRVGPTLILEDGRHLLSNNLHAVMVSSIAMDGSAGDSPPPSPTAAAVRLKKNPKAQRQQQLLSKLQSQMNSLSAPWTHLREWRHKAHSLAISSDVPVYRINGRASSLYLCDADQPLSTPTVARAFLDNVMAGIPSLTLARHRDGQLVGSFTQVSTREIPALATTPLLSVAQIEYNATALLDFLKSNCAPDMTSFLFLKPVGSKVAGLWRIDPAADELMETDARDRLVFNMAMLCVRAAMTRPPSEAARLLRHALALLDQAAAFGGEPRALQRVTLCERLAEHGLQLGAAEALTEAAHCVGHARALLTAINASGTAGNGGGITDARLCDVALRVKVAQAGLVSDDLKAIELLSSALASFGSPELYPRTYALALAHIGDAMRRLAKKKSGDEAVSFARMAAGKYEAACAARPSKTNLAGLGACYNELGQRLVASGRVAEGLIEFEKGCNVLMDAGDIANLSSVAANLAVGYRSLAQQPSSSSQPWQPSAEDDGFAGAEPIVKRTTGETLFMPQQAVLYTKALAVLAKARDLARKLKADVPVALAAELCKTELLWGFQLARAARALAGEGSDADAARVADVAYDKLSQAVSDAPARSAEFYSAHLQLGALETLMVPWRTASAARKKAEVLATLAERHLTVCTKGLPKTSPIAAVRLSGGPHPRK